MRRYLILIIIIEIILFALNYISGTHLIGWDNVMPEFNLWLNLKRSIFAVWQDYRGLGLVDGMAHAANLLHTIYVAVLSLFLPQSMVRYVFIHLTHLIGGIGLFYLAKKLTNNKHASFIASLFYMFNLGIIQMYYAPLEVFAVHFAALPLMALFVTKTLENPSKKNIIALLILSILTTSQGFVPTVFLAFLILLFFFLFFYFLTTRKFKNLLIVSLIIFSANAFWALPYAYSAWQNASTIKNTRINQFSSEEIFYRNKAHGDLISVLTLKGFMLDTVEYDQNENKDIFFMDIWKKHQDSLFYKLIFFPFLGIAFVGLVQALRRSNKQLLPYVASFLVGLVFLANNTMVFEQFNSIIRSLFPIVGEAFRFPFTKFITLFVFCFSIFLSYGLSRIFQIRSFRKYFQFLPIVALFFLALPSFQGNFTSPLLKLKLPQNYQETFAYFDTLDENKRIALLPAYTFWNWQYRDFGQRGSGFLWYGIKQPILDRAFDPWSGLNEQFYNELSYALKTNDINLLENVLKKYDIAYILLDQHLINTLANRAINYDSIKTLLENTPFVKKTKAFGKISIYETGFATDRLAKIDAQTTPRIFPNFSYEDSDQIFNDVGNYVVSPKNPTASYLFPSLYTGKLQEDREFEAIEHDNDIVLVPKKKFSSLASPLILEIPSLFASEFLIPVTVKIENQKIILNPSYPKIFINNQEIAITSEPIVLVPKIVRSPTSITFEDIKHELKTTDKNLKSFLLNPYLNAITVNDGFREEVLFFDTNTVDRKAIRIQINDQEIKDIKVVIEKFDTPLNLTHNGSTLEAKGNTKELSFYKEDLPHQASYIAFIKVKYLSGLPLNFSIDNPFEERAELETKLSKKATENIIILPKTESYAQGYGFHLAVKSVGQELAKTVVEDFRLYPFPATLLRQLKLVTNTYYEIDKNQSVKTPLQFTKINPSLYTIQLSSITNNQQLSTLVLSQSFDPGWKAYQIKNQKSKIKNVLINVFPFLFGKELTEHVLVNNWQNGWVLNNLTMKQFNNETIVIVYLPQYLEYVGFIILGATVLLILIVILRKKSA